MMCHRIGQLPMVTMGLGMRSVSSDKRVPSPPARMTAFMLSRPREREILCAKWAPCQHLVQLSEEPLGERREQDILGQGRAQSGLAHEFAQAPAGKQRYAAVQLVMRDDIAGERVERVVLENENGALRFHHALHLTEEFQPVSGRHMVHYTNGQSEIERGVGERKFRAIV